MDNIFLTKSKTWSSPTLGVHYEAILDPEPTLPKGLLPDFPNPTRGIRRSQTVKNCILLCIQFNYLLQKLQISPQAEVDIYFSCTMDRTGESDECAELQIGKLCAPRDILPVLLLANSVFRFVFGLIQRASGRHKYLLIELAIYRHPPLLILHHWLSTDQNLRFKDPSTSKYRIIN